MFTLQWERLGDVVFVAHTLYFQCLRVCCECKTVWKKPRECLLAGERGGVKSVNVIQSESNKSLYRRRKSTKWAENPIFLSTNRLISCLTACICIFIAPPPREKQNWMRLHSSSYHAYWGWPPCGRSFQRGCPWSWGGSTGTDGTGAGGAPSWTGPPPPCSLHSCLDWVQLRETNLTLNTQLNTNQIDKDIARTITNVFKAY